MNILKVSLKRFEELNLKYLKLKEENKQLQREVELKDKLIKRLKEKVIQND